jgi:hypothetical protein
MDGYMLEKNVGDSTLYQYKVNHPYTSNNIVQMRSACCQPYFDRSGQVSFYLGRPQMSQNPYKIEESQTLQLIKQNRINSD